MLNFLDRFFQILDFFRARPYRIIGPGYFEYLYREGKRRVLIHCEPSIGFEKGDMMVDSSSLVRWLPPYEDELIPEEKREQILQRFGETLNKEETSYWVNYNSAFEEQERQKAMMRRAEKQQR